MLLDLIDLNQLILQKEGIKEQWNDSQKPFRYFVYDGFFKQEVLASLLEEYPNVNKGVWNGTTYIHQKNKFTKTEFDDSTPLLKEAFAEFNSNEFLRVLESVTGIKDLLPDNKLFGGGLHQSITGAFLDVHVDFNIHEETGFHRRMNAIVYMNPTWKEEYNGYLELWDMDKKRRIEYIEPKLNRLVVFETNQVSYHGHPKPLQTPEGLSRKSLAVYYYTKERDAHEIAPKHNTKYINTQGVNGMVKNLLSGVKAYFERLKK